MTEILDYIGGVLLHAFARLALPGDPFSLLSLVAGLLFAAGFLLWRRRRNRSISFRSVRRYLLPPRIWRHRSTRLDLRLFASNIILWAVIYGVAIVTSTIWRDFTLSGLTAALGPGTSSMLPVWPVVVLVTVVVFLAFDLGYWVAHWTSHNVPWLWEFHKVHHSAEVLTPFTEWRQNPFEDLLFSNVIAFTVGLTYGVLVYLLGPAAKEMTLLDTNILMLAYYVTMHHLRHSHVWWPLGGVLGHIIHSPAHHQIHHSTDPRHLNKNLGLFLVVWDWAFGTLCMPRRNERIRIGLGKSEAPFLSVRDVYVRPFVRAARCLMPRRRAKAAAGES